MAGADQRAAARKAPVGRRRRADADPRRRQRLSATRDRSSPPIARSIAKTGTIRISATFPNPDRIAAPGPVRPRPRRDAACATDALLVPQRAVTELQGSLSGARGRRRQQGEHAARSRSASASAAAGSSTDGPRARRRASSSRARPTRDGTVVHAEAVRRRRRRRTEPMSRFFIGRPDRRHRHRHRHRARRPGGDAGAADRAVPRHHPAADHASPATYTGADALTIEQSVATPLEQQMNGVDNMLYMQSTNANDGTMQLTVTFDVATDPNIDQVNVQNRMAQAQPNLPPDVNTFGLTMRKATGFPMLIVSLSSPKNTYDALFLANYANINIIDALYRVPGVGDVRIFGAGDYAMRIWVKPDRLAQARPHRARSRARRAAAEHGQPVRPDRRAAGAVRTGDDLHRPRAGTAADGGGVRRHRRALEPGRLGRAAARTSRASSSARSTTSRSAASTASRACGDRRLPDARLERARRRRRRQEGRWRTCSTRFPARPRLHATRSTRPLPVSEGIREILITLGERDRARDLRRLSCSCRTGAPRSSRCSPCRCR